MRNLSGLNDLNSLSGLNNLFSLISSKKITELDFAIKSDLFCSDKNSLFSWFLTHFLLEAVEDKDVTFDQTNVS